MQAISNLRGSVDGSGDTGDLGFGRTDDQGELPNCELSNTALEHMLVVIASMECLGNVFIKYQQCQPICQ